VSADPVLLMQNIAFNMYAKLAYSEYWFYIGLSKLRSDIDK